MQYDREATEVRLDRLTSVLERDEPALVAADPAPAVAVSRRDTSRVRWRLLVLLTQVLVIAVVLALWEFLPTVPGIASKTSFLDPYFISSPSRIFTKMAAMVTGGNGGPLVWPYVWPTFGSALMGTVIGLVVGGAVGLVLGSFRFAGQVFRPFVVALNAVPRIALVPVIVVIMGAGMASSTVIAVIVVLFVGLFNAQEGARTVERHVLDNAKLLGARGWDIMWRVRFRYGLAWTLASLPIAVSFAIVSVVAGEILIGGQGLGSLMSQAAVSADSDLTFSVIVFLALFALVILALAELFKRRILRWWTAGQAD